MDPLIGQTLDGRYQVLSHLGEGGMGAVYKAEHIAMAQPVAIKVLLTESTNDPSMVKRFIREARSCFRIDHPNCVRVTDFGASATGSLYFAMEYLDGRTLGIDLHVDGAMSSARVRHIAGQIAEALGHAHGLGLIHRDLKPGNIMLIHRDGDPDFVKVFDFGLGKLVDEGAQLTGLTMSPLTQDGIVFGTPEYMSPQQAKGESLTPASDIYTLGVCCYEMLTEHLPFEGKTFTEILSKHVTKAPEPPSKRFPHLAIDPQLEALVMRCLSKDPESRPSGPEFAQALRTTAAQAAQPAAHLAPSETLLVSQESMASIGIAASQQAARPSEDSSGLRKYIPVLAVALGLLAVLVYFAARDGGTSSSPPAVSASADADATPLLPADASAAANAAQLDAGPAPTPDAAAKDSIAPTIKATPSKPRRKRIDKSPKTSTPDRHLQAAERARREGKLLKQLSEANASLKLHPKGKRAAYLAGEALQKSGDKVAACKFFRRAGRRHYAAAGCSD